VTHSGGQRRLAKEAPDRLSADAQESAPRPVVAFGTKAETLERLARHVRTASVPPQVRFTVAQWQAEDPEIWRALWAAPWSRGRLIVRSSALNEDGREASQAGRFCSIADVDLANLPAAVEQVIASYEPSDPRHQVFVQPLVRNVTASGVAFTQDPNSRGHYIVINYDTDSSSTDGVTAGRSENLQTFILSRGHQDNAGAMRPIVDLLAELEALLGCAALDVEFATDADGTLHLLQARPLAAAGKRIDPRHHRQLLEQIRGKMAQLNLPHPYLHGQRTVLGIMPDWNPAEIIGVRPRPLALSLYRELITDSIWAYQRDAYGYKNLRSFPLLVSLHGQPYVDVRVSFNSFLPKAIDGALADRLVDHYIERLIASPYLHDKVEFEIILSCYSFDLPEKLDALRRAGFSADECITLADALRGLTNQVISRNGLWQKDLERVAELERRMAAIERSGLDEIGRLYWLLEDCKRYGTLPFAGLARAGFIAVQMLRSLVATGVLSQDDHDRFMSGLNTVSSRLGHDFAELRRDAFLARYGHLRPGTYDITSPRYDEAADRYFDWTASRPSAPPSPSFTLSLPQLQKVRELLDANRIEHDPVSLFEFIKAGIEGREYAKFLFTRSLSDALALLGRLAGAHGFSLEDCAYADIGCVRDLYASCLDPGGVLARSIAEGRRRYADAQSLVLPPLITEPEDVLAFTLPPLRPNFITQQSVIAPVARGTELAGPLAGAIVCIESADPGYDWIFSRGVAGLITAHGGVNSHMAIRAGELGIPAVIGAGEQLYRRWSAASRLSLDCANCKVEVLG
jgi:glutamine kinase